MGQAIGASLPLAIAVALSPVRISTVLVILTADSARINGPAFVLGWLAGLGAIGAIALSIADSLDANSSGSPAIWVSWVKLVLGATLLVAAAYQFRRRPRDHEDAALPGWMATAGTIGSPAAFGLGAALACASPKNLLLAAAAAASIAQTGISGAKQAIAYVIFALIGTIGVGSPVVIYFTRGERSAKLLGELKDSLSQHGAVIMSVLCLIIGTALIGNAISALT